MSTEPLWPYWKATGLWKAINAPMNSFDVLPYWTPVMGAACRYNGQTFYSANMVPRPHCKEPLRIWTNFCVAVFEGLDGPAVIFPPSGVSVAQIAGFCYRCAPGHGGLAHHVGYTVGCFTLAGQMPTPMASLRLTAVLDSRGEPCVAYTDGLGVFDQDRKPLPYGGTSHMEIGFVDEFGVSLVGPPWIVEVKRRHGMRWATGSVISARGRKSTVQKANRDLRRERGVVDDDIDPRFQVMYHSVRLPSNAEEPPFAAAANDSIPRDIMTQILLGGHAPVQADGRIVRPNSPTPSVLVNDDPDGDDDDVEDDGSAEPLGLPLIPDRPQIVELTVARANDVLHQSPVLAIPTTLMVSDEVFKFGFFHDEIWSQSECGMLAQIRSSSRRPDTRIRPIGISVFVGRIVRLVDMAKEDRDSLVFDVRYDGLEVTLCVADEYTDGTTNAVRVRDILLPQPSDSWRSLPVVAVYSRSQYPGGRCPGWSDGIYPCLLSALNWQLRQMCPDCLCNVVALDHHVNCCHARIAEFIGLDNCPSGHTVSEVIARGQIVGTGVDLRCQLITPELQLHEYVSPHYRADLADQEQDYSSIERNALLPQLTSTFSYPSDYASWISRRVGVLGSLAIRVLVKRFQVADFEDDKARQLANKLARAADRRVCTDHVPGVTVDELLRMATVTNRELGIGDGAKARVGGSATATAPVNILSVSDLLGMARVVGPNQASTARVGNPPTVSSVTDILAMVRVAKTNDDDQTDSGPSPLTAAHATSAQDFLDMIRVGATTRKPERVPNLSLQDFLDMTRVGTVAIDADQLLEHTRQGEWGLSADAVQLSTVPIHVDDVDVPASIQQIVEEVVSQQNPEPTAIRGQATDQHEDLAYLLAQLELQGEEQLMDKYDVLVPEPEDEDPAESTEFSPIEVPKELRAHIDYLNQRNQPVDIRYTMNTRVPKGAQPNDVYTAGDTSYVVHKGSDGLFGVPISAPVCTLDDTSKALPTEVLYRSNSIVDGKPLFEFSLGEGVPGIPKQGEKIFPLADGHCWERVPVLGGQVVMFSNTIELLNEFVVSNLCLDKLGYRVMGVRFSLVTKGERTMITTKWANDKDKTLQKGQSYFNVAAQPFAQSCSFVYVPRRKGNLVVPRASTAESTDMYSYLQHVASQSFPFGRRQVLDSEGGMRTVDVRATVCSHEQASRRQRAIMYIFVRIYEMFSLSLVRCEDMNRYITVGDLTRFILSLTVPPYTRHTWCWFTGTLIGRLGDAQRNRARGAVPYAAALESVGHLLSRMTQYLIEQAFLVMTGQRGVFPLSLILPISMDFADMPIEVRRRLGDVCFYQDYGQYSAVVDSIPSSSRTYFERYGTSDIPAPDCHAYVSLQITASGFVTYGGVRHVWYDADELGIFYPSNEQKYIPRGELWSHLKSLKVNTLQPVGDYIGYDEDGLIVVVSRSSHWMHVRNMKLLVDDLEFGPCDLVLK